MAPFTQQLLPADMDAPKPNSFVIANKRVTQPLSYGEGNILNFKMMLSCLCWYILVLSPIILYWKQF